MSIFKRKSNVTWYRQPRFNYTAEECEKYVQEIEPKLEAFVAKIDDNELTFSKLANKPKTMVQTVAYLDGTTGPVESMSYVSMFDWDRNHYENFKHSSNIIDKRCALELFWNTINFGKTNEMFIPGEAYYKKLQDALDKIAGYEIQLLRLKGNLKVSENATIASDEKLANVKEKLKTLKLPNIYKELFPEDFDADFKSDLKPDNENEDEEE